MLSIPDYGVTPFGGGLAKISKEIDDFHAINKQITTANHITYFGITPTSRLAANDKTLQQMMVYILSQNNTDYGHRN